MDNFWILQGGISMAQKSNVYNPKITGILIASILLVMIVILILVSTVIIVFANRSGPETTTDPNGTGDKPAVTTTVPPKQTTDKTDPGNDPEIIKPSYIDVEHSAINQGALLLIDESHFYLRDGLINYRELNADKAEKLGFSVVPESSDYSRTHYNLYLSKDANNAFQAMAKQLCADVGNGLQVRNAYYYKANMTAITSQDDLEAMEHSTGMVVDLQCYVNGSQYTLTHNSQKAYYEWLRANAYKYGYIWVRDTNKYSTFRYVGIPHAAAMNKLSVDLNGYLEAVKSYTFVSNFKVNDTEGNEWWIYYAEAEAGAPTVNVAVVGDESNYMISGDNVSGLIIAINSTTFAR